MDTRTRLIEATRELLWERGYSATSPREILKRADAGQGSMYHHFAGKEELAVAAIEESAAVMRAEADALLSMDGTASSRVIAYLQRQRDSLRGCRIGRMTYDAEVLATPDLLRPVENTFSWLVDRIADVIREGVNDRELPPKTDPHHLAAMIVATVQGGYVLARASQDPNAFDAAVDGAVGLLSGWSRA
ncbi:TetR/AcrR family transcriptional regulator [Leifsonia aquatica]|uniref:TetR/AcrR family transcriptional regulator n=1 Tax=Leifsonia aquatica TaxID=144185 RepID=UPI00382D3A32